MVQVPLLMFDRETDRQGARYGTEGGAWLRWSALKSLESSASTVTWEDHTTGERAEAYVERVTLNRTSPPSKGFTGAGGIAQVLLRLV
jgi:hypothetical protein